MNWMRPSVRFTAVLPALLLGLCLAPDARSEDDRPEPMVFDLVDPLGATPGKTEINTLLGYSPRTGDMAWSPEIEFAFAKGHSIEF